MTRSFIIGHSGASCHYQKPLRLKTQEARFARKFADCIVVKSIEWSHYVQQCRRLFLYKSLGNHSSRSWWNGTYRERLDGLISDPFSAFRDSTLYCSVHAREFLIYSSNNFCFLHSLWNIPIWCSWLRIVVPTSRHFHYKPEFFFYSLCIVTGLMLYWANSWIRLLIICVFLILKIRA